MGNIRYLGVGLLYSQDIINTFKNTLFLARVIFTCYPYIKEYIFKVDLYQALHLAEKNKKLTGVRL